MYSKTIRKYNEMGDGFDEYVIINDKESIEGAAIIHVGKFSDIDTQSSVNTRFLDKRGLRKDK